MSAALAAALVLGAKASGLTLATYSISSSSMAPTLGEGDIVGADSMKGYCGRTHPKPGDVVIHRRASSPSPFLARVVAGPGQTVAMHLGRLSVDGRPVALKVVGKTAWQMGIVAQVIRETLPNGASYLTVDAGSDRPLDEVAPVRMPRDSWYLLGDNRDNAADSRVPVSEGGAGFISSKDLCGIVNSVIWSKETSHVGSRP